MRAVYFLMSALACLISGSSSLALPVKNGPAGDRALALDVDIQGKIVSIDLTGGGDYAFRVTLEGEPAMCGTQARWVYVDTNYSNYQAMTAGLLAAYHAGKSVTIFSRPDGSGYCMITYVRT